MKIFDLELEGRPVPWARVKRGRNGRSYTPAKQREHRDELALMLKSLSKGMKFEGGVSLSCEFDYGNNLTRIRVRDAHATAEPYGWFIKRPDIDNCLKLVLEALQDSGMVEDDSQVVEVVARKIR